jgi:hypothetical protein
MTNVDVIAFPEAAVRLARVEPAIPLMRVLDTDTLEVFLPDTATSPRIEAIQEDLKALFGVRTVHVLLVQGMPTHRIIGDWGED